MTEKLTEPVPSLAARSAKGAPFTGWIVRAVKATGWLLLAPILLATWTMAADADPTERPVAYPDVWGGELPVPDWAADYLSSGMAYFSPTGGIYIDYRCVEPTDNNEVFFSNENVRNIIYDLFERKIVKEFDYKNGKQVSPGIGLSQFIRENKMMYKPTLSVESFVRSRDKKRGPLDDGGFFSENNVGVYLEHHLERKDQHGNELFRKVLVRVTPFFQTMFGNPESAFMDHRRRVKVHSNSIPLKTYLLEDGTILAVSYLYPFAFRLTKDLENPFIDRSDEFIWVDYAVTSRLLQEGIREGFKALKGNLGKDESEWARMVETVDGYVTPKFQEMLAEKRRTRK